MARLEKLNDLLVSDKSRRYCVLTKFSDYFINRSPGKIVISFSDVLYDYVLWEAISKLSTDFSTEHALSII